MNKILYLTTWDFSDGPSSGITKKIKAQMGAFEKEGFCVDYSFISNNIAYFIRNGQKIELGKVGRFRKLAANYYLYKFLKNETYPYVYNRYGLMDPFYFRALKLLSNRGSRIVIEIPTYPYDKERLRGIIWWALYTLDKLYRNRMKSYIYRIVTYSKDEKIFGIPAILIKNGIDFTKVAVRNPKNVDSTIHFLAVAGFANAHGYDRMIKGLGEYYQRGGGRNLIFHLVGAGEPEVEYRKLIKEYALEERCILHGVQSGASLDEMYNICDIGVESLGDFRNGIYVSSSLKSREYVAKGLPFITACESDAFEGMNYVLKIPAEESPVDIDVVLKFYDILYKGKKKEVVASMIRNSAEQKCDIAKTMEPVINLFRNGEKK